MLLGTFFRSLIILFNINLKYTLPDKLPSPYKCQWWHFTEWSGREIISILISTFISILGVLYLMISEPHPTFRWRIFGRNLNFSILICIMILHNTEWFCPTFSHKPSLILIEIKLFYYLFFCLCITNDTLENYSKILCYFWNLLLKVNEGWPNLFEEFYARRW